MKRWIAGILCAALALGMIGCGGQQQTDADGQQQQEQEQEQQQGYSKRIDPFGAFTGELLGGTREEVLAADGALLPASELEGMEMLQLGAQAASDPQSLYRTQQSAGVTQSVFFHFLAYSDVVYYIEYSLMGEENDETDLQDYLTVEQYQQELTALVTELEDKMESAVYQKQDAAGTVRLDSLKEFLSHVDALGPTDMVNHFISGVIDGRDVQIETTLFSNTGDIRYRVYAAPDDLPPLPQELDPLGILDGGDLGISAAELKERHPESELVYNDGYKQYVQTEDLIYDVTHYVQEDTVQMAGYYLYAPEGRTLSTQQMQKQAFAILPELYYRSTAVGEIAIYDGQTGAQLHSYGHINALLIKLEEASLEDQTVFQVLLGKGAGNGMLVLMLRIWPDGDGWQMCYMILLQE